MVRSLRATPANLRRAIYESLSLSRYRGCSTAALFSFGARMARFYT